MLDKLRNLLAPGPEEPPTSDDLAEALEETHAGIRNAAARAERLRATRAERLLEASDQELDDLDEEIAAAEREVERLEVGASKLEQEIPKAKKREKDDDLQARRKRAAALTQEQEEDADRYERLAAEIAAVLTRMAAREEQIAGLDVDMDSALVIPGWRNGAWEIRVTDRHSYDTLRATFGDGLAVVQLPSLRSASPHHGDRPAFDRGLPTQTSPARPSRSPVGVFDEQGREIPGSWPGRRR